ncbi:MAG TPA: hypothetical protein VLS93_15535, partial [Anaeromyxobacteraceae bacterium]|nr:hypothetical protein [Anaeromyxobacteraceae bacterium]
GSGPRIRGPSAVPAPPRLAPRGAPAPPRVAPAMRPPPRGGGVHTPVVDGWIEAVGQAPGPEAPAGDAWAVAPGADPWDVPPGAEPWAGPGRPDDVPEPALPPAAELDVARRGFFARDAFVVDLVLVERRTGRAVWAKAIRRDADARNPRAVAECIEEGLAELGWAAPSAP